METPIQKDDAPHHQPVPETRGCLFAETPPGITVGVLTSVEESSSLSLLAAGIAGLAERHARRNQRK